ncbi:hypothetical protein AAFF_G00346100, partial [Aldrovandia affinis]
KERKGHALLWLWFPLPLSLSLSLSGQAETGEVISVGLLFLKRHSYREDRAVCKKESEEYTNAHSHTRAHTRTPHVPEPETSTTNFALNLSTRSSRYGQQGSRLRPEPRGAEQDRQEVRPGAGGAAGGVDCGPVRVRSGPARGRKARFPSLAEGWLRPERADQQPVFQRQAHQEDPDLGDGFQTDGAGLAVPERRRALRHRQDRHVPDRGPLGGEGSGRGAENPHGLGQPGGYQGRWQLPRRPQLVPQEGAGEPTGLQR